MIDMICKILAPAASKKGLPYYPRENMSMGEFFELHEKTMEHIIYPSFEQVGLDNKQYLSILRKIRNLLDHPKGSKHVNLIRYLLKPCSFGHAVVMMEKGAVVFSDYYNKYCTISAESIGAFKVFVDFGEGASWYSFDTYVRDLIGSKFRYAPWFKDGVVDKELKDFCDDILGVKNED